MRVAIVIAIIIFTPPAHSQSIIQNRWQPGVFGNSFLHPIPFRDSSAHSKWSFSRYASVSIGYSFFKGGNASFVSVPVGIQLNRQLNNHLYAFAGLTAAPACMNFNSTFIPTDTKAAGSFFTRNNNLGLYSRAELGLTYVNDAKTFSISGSIGVERNSVPMYYSAPVITKQYPSPLPQ